MEVSQPGPSVTSLDDSGLAASTAYFYRVRVETGTGLSAYSNEATATTSALPLPPAPSLQATAVSSSLIHLAWTSTATGALRFRLERRSGTAAYTEISQPTASSTGFDDSGLAASSAYSYRLRVETSVGLSPYSSEVTATTSAAPLPAAPTLQATTVSSSQIQLSWNSAATGILRFHLERRSGTGSYAEINQPAPSATAFDDTSLTAATTYFYRIRVETGAGLSAYSGEATATTTQALPAAPSNLRATPTSTTQVSLTWTNNAPSATAIRIEAKASTSSAFADIGAAATLASTGISNLQANTAYTFRVRAQNAVGYSTYSNEAMVTTLSVPITVFLVHGLNQGFQDMKNLAVNLAASYGLTPGRFRMDYGFDFSDCADATLLVCPSGCTIPDGARRLAQYIVSTNPPGDIVVIGFSMGGLLARDMIVNNRIVLNGRKINLVTIGTPNLGYPYVATDSLVFCDSLVSSMNGNWRSQPGSVALSNYLLSLTNEWSADGFPGSGRIWLAASGRAINDPIRSSTGCRDQNPYSDGVVCQDSAAYNVSTAVGTQPNYGWADPTRSYVHSFSGFTSLILGNTTDQTRYLPLWNPPPNGALFTTLVSILNGL